MEVLEGEPTYQVFMQVQVIGLRESECQVIVRCPDGHEMAVDAELLSVEPANEIAEALGDPREVVSE